MCERNRTSAVTTVSLVSVKKNYEPTYVIIAFAFRLTMHNFICIPRLQISIYLKYTINQLYILIQ